MRTLRLTILCLFFPALLFAQQSFSGRVVDAISQKPIMYATITLAGQKTGVNADDNGRFVIYGTWSDTLLVSSVGYQALLVPLVEWKADMTIQLPHNEKLLKPVLIKNDWSYQDVGSFKVKTNYSFISETDQIEVARRLQSAVSEAWLDKVVIATSSRGGKFLLRVYDMDPLSGGPGEELTDSAIVVLSRGKRTTINVKDYRIYLPRNAFFIAVQWLILAENEYPVFFGTKGGKQEKRIYYKPSISFSEELIADSKACWVREYQRKWNSSFSQGKNSLAISATVRY